MVSLIILSYNTEAVLRRCLTSIFARLRKGSFEVIVVDNASSDGSVAMIRKAFPQVHVVENRENVGFAAGCNIGAEHAKGEYLLFLNSDMELESDILPPLIAVFSEKNAGIVGAQLVNSDGSLQRSYGSFYTLPHVLRLLFGGEKAELKTFSQDKLASVDWVSGGLMLVRKKEFVELEGFDETFFMYIEDMEFCYRMHLSGRSVYVQPAVRVKHLGHGSSNKTFAVVQIYRGLQYFYKKHKNTLQYTMLRLLLAIKAIISLCVGYLSGNAYLTKTYREGERRLSHTFYTVSE